MVAEPPTEDLRRRSDKDKRFWCQCAFCKRWFKHANNEVRVCGALLSPPEARCMLYDDFGVRWWPKNKPLPDLMEIEEKQRQALAEHDAELARRRRRT